jgi:hypothetical protein
MACSAGTCAEKNTLRGVFFGVDLPRSASTIQQLVEFLAQVQLHEVIEPAHV